LANETGNILRWTLAFRDAGLPLWDTLTFEKEVHGATENDKGCWQ
jgi:hypothetical protein